MDNEDYKKDLMKSHNLVTKKGSVLKKYQDAIVGNRSLLFLIYFELCQFMGIIPGAIGILLRKIFWPKLFKFCPKSVTFGKNIILRHPDKIKIGKNVVISDYCTLDARSLEKELVIELGDDGILSEFVRLSSKNGFIKIGNRFGIGVFSTIHSGKDDHVIIGDDVLFGPRVYITGGGNYKTDRTDITIREQGKKTTGGTIIENDIWLGANVSVMGGIEVRKGCVIGTGSVVTKSTDEYSIYVGVPAKKIKNRKEDYSIHKTELVNE